MRAQATVGDVSPVVGRRLLWSGLLAPLVIAASVLSESVTHGGVNPWQQSISLLSEGPGGRLLRVGLVVGGCLTLAFAGSLRMVWGNARAVYRSQAAMGLGYILTGLFIQQGLAPPSGPRVPSPWGYLTPVGVVHVLASGVLYTAIAISGAAVARSVPHQPAWRNAARYSAFTAVAMVVLLPAFVVTAGIGGPSGLLERMAGLMAVLWEGWWAALLLARGAPRSLADLIGGG